jgi:hypothetical protein
MGSVAGRTLWMLWWQLGCLSRVGSYIGIRTRRVRAAQENTMSSFMSLYLVPIAIGAVAIVLVLGLVNMMRGGSPSTSQKLMRLRVLLQFVAIIIIMATIWMMGR